MNIPIVYEDEWLVIVDKPAGLLTIPTPKNEKRTLTSILNEELEENNISYRLHPCHRLDRETSGLIIYAKGKSAQKHMMEEFRQHRIKKSYIAFVQGQLEKNEGSISTPIEGKSALTKYRVTENRKDFSIIEAVPLSGRTNQIRIHFKNINHPILGDTKFSLRRDFKVKAKRLCLHARSLEFLHPVTKKIVRLDLPLPLDMRKIKEGVH